MRSLFLLIILYSCSLFSFGQNATDFRTPLDIPLLLSGNFGELRTDHFHSGIDIKTRGSIGHNVFAVESGYVSRIKVQPGGYGKALYIAHPNGYTSVYGHLSEYNQAIGNFVKKYQYRNESHEVDLYLKPGDLSIKKGDIIALSGNTGSSAGPHLHFEIRKSGPQHPLNVLLFNFPIRDDIAPVINLLGIYPLEGAQIDQRPEDLYIKVLKSDKAFILDRDEKILAYGDIGFGIEVFDYLNGSRNRCGIFSIELIADGKRVYYSEMDEFSFNESRFINSHIDYKLKRDQGRSVQKLFKLPYNELSIYKHIENRGHISITDTLNHSILIRTTDSHGNVSELPFNIKGIGAKRQMTADYVERGSKFLYNSGGTFTDQNIRLSYPAYCFYENIYFNFARTKGSPKTYSDIFHLHNEGTPVHKSMELNIRPSAFPIGKQDKLCLIKLEDDDEISYAGGNFENEYVKGSIRSFGSYAVSIDTIPPEIQALNINAARDFSKQESINFDITDELSGIATYNGFIDNKWVLFEYDPKNDLLFHKFDDKLLNEGKKHELEIYLTDAKGNASVYHTIFYR